MPYCTIVLAVRVGAMKLVCASNDHRPGLSVRCGVRQFLTTYRTRPSPPMGKARRSPTLLSLRSARAGARIRVSPRTPNLDVPSDETISPNSRTRDRPLGSGERVEGHHTTRFSQGGANTRAGTPCTRRERRAPWRRNIARLYELSWLPSPREATNLSAKLAR